MAEGAVNYGNVEILEKCSGGALSALGLHQDMKSAHACDLLQFVIPIILFKKMLYTCNLLRRPYFISTDYLHVYFKVTGSTS